MATFNKVNNFLLELGKKTLDLVNDVPKVALFQSTSNISASSTYYAALTNEVANGNGYTTGGSTIASPTWSLSGASAQFANIAATTWTASSSGFAFQYIVYYDSTPSNKAIIGYYDYGSTLTLSGANGDQFTVTPAGGILFSLT